MSQAPSFSLADLHGSVWRRSGKAVLAFVETDCPTCALAAPYLNRLNGGAEVVAISQDPVEATRDFASRLELEFPVLLDEGLEVSRQFDPVSVPTIYVVGEDNEIERTIEGFSKQDLNELSRALGGGPIADEHDGAPAEKPGCMSRHREALTEGAAAPALDIASTRGVRAGRIELPADSDLEDYCREHFDDPLPVVPPTVERVERMLAATDLPPERIIGRVPPNYGAATVEKIAANAVMAGCEPAMMRVLMPMVRAMCDERFDLHGLQATTHLAMPLIVINGPVRDELGFNYRAGVFSNAVRANSTLGRTLRLLARNLGGARPGEIDMATFGSPGHFAYCIAEHEDANPWEPLHVDRGFEASQSALTLYAAEPPRNVADHKPRDGRVVLRSITYALRNVWSPKLCGTHEAMVVFSPEHAETIGRTGMTKQEVREFLFENTGVPVRDYDTPNADGSEGTQPRARSSFKEIVIDGEPCYQKFARPESIHLCVAGGPAGKFSVVLGSWAAGPRGSQMVTYPVD